MPVVVDTYDDVSTRWPVGHCDNVFHKLEDIFLVLEVQAGLKIQVSLFRRR